MEYILGILVFALGITLALWRKSAFDLELALSYSRSYLEGLRKWRDRAFKAEEAAASAHNELDRLRGAVRVAIGDEEDGDEETE